jgi:hypothetical protein
MKLRVPPTEKNFPGYKIAPQVFQVTPREQLEYIAITLSETLRIAWKAGLERLMRVTRRKHGITKISKIIDNVELNSSDMKRYVLDVHEDEHGECFITLPEELLEETGWGEGTNLEWSEEIDGSIILKKVEE